MDEVASDEQAGAFERIISGKEGGPFGDFAATHRRVARAWSVAAVSFSDGDAPSASIIGADFTFEPLEGPEGSGAQTTVKNAAFGFAPEFRVGRTLEAT